MAPPTSSSYVLYKPQASIAYKAFGLQAPDMLKYVQEGIFTNVAQQRRICHGKKLTEHIDDLPEERKAIINRLRRIEGQLRGIQRMIIEEKPCVEVLTQLSAARNAMQQACVEIIKKNMYKCIRESTNTDKNIEELEKLVSALINLAPSTNL